MMSTKVAPLGALLGQERGLFVSHEGRIIQSLWPWPTCRNYFGLLSFVIPNAIDLGDRSMNPVSVSGSEDGVINVKCYDSED